MLGMNIKAIGIFLLFMLSLCAVAKLGGFLEERDKQSGICRPDEVRSDRVHWRCQDGRDFWRVRKGENK